MNIVKILLMIIKLIQHYGVFENDEFEYFEIDQRPAFYLGVFTLREKE